MSTVLCKHGGYCVRAIGHAGAHTACPSAATLDWDHGRYVLQEREAVLMALDFETPWYADLNDPL